MNYIFVVDVAVDEKELKAIKTSLLELVDSSESERGIGLISYDKYVNLCDLGSSIPTNIKMSPN